MKCGKIYSDDEINLMNACTCGARFFLYSKTVEGLKTKGILETPEEKVFGVKDEISVERIGDTILMRKKEIEPEAEKTEAEKTMHVEEPKKQEPEEEFKIKSLWDEEWNKKPETKVGEEKKEKEEKKEGPEERIKEGTEKRRKPEKKPEKDKEKQKEGMEQKKEELEKELEKKDMKEEKYTRHTEEDISWLEKEFKLPESSILSLDTETLRILKKGKYEIDVAALMSGKPLVIETKKGVYYIHLPTAMKKKKK